MKKILKIYNKELVYTVRESRVAKSMRVSVSLDKGIVATLPYNINQKHLEKFLYEHFYWLKKRVDDFKKVDKAKLIKTGPNDFLRKKKEVFELVTEKINKFNEFYNFSFKKICIRNQKTRWGSCSNKKNLNFSYKLAYLPEDLVDYVVVHELCHLQEMNHSKNFWNLVEKLIPKHKAKRKQLKEASKYFV